MLLLHCPLAIVVQTVLEVARDRCVSLMEDPFADWDVLAARLVSSLNSAGWSWLALAAVILLWQVAARYPEWLPRRFLACAALSKVGDAGIEPATSAV